MPANSTTPAAARALENVGLADEGGDEARARARIDLLRVALLHQLARLHDRDAVGERQRLALVVRDEDEGAADLLVDAAQLLLHRLPELQVERRERLVEQQHLRPHDERARQRHALLLAARKLLDRAVGKLGRDAPAPACRRRAGRSPPAAAWRSSARRRCSGARSCAGTGRSPGTPCWSAASPGRAASRRRRRSRPCRLVGMMKPPIMRSSVVLPQPEGPRMATKSPRAMSRSSGFTATVVPKLLETPRSRTSGPAAADAADAAARRVQPANCPSGSPLTPASMAKMPPASGCSASSASLSP